MNRVATCYMGPLIHYQEIMLKYTMTHAEHLSESLSIDKFTKSKQWTRYRLFVKTPKFISQGVI